MEMGKEELGMVSQSIAKSYDAFYFAQSCGRPYQRDDEWLRFFATIADRIVNSIRPSTVLDAGCAIGFLVEALRDRGVDAVGVDISEYAIRQGRSDIQPYCWVGSICDPFPQKYDLLVCIEVLEHLPANEAEPAVENFCQCTEDVLISSTPFDYKEVTHLNVRPPDYWAELFARHGFFRDVDFDASFISPWAVRFRRVREPVARIVATYERRLWQVEKDNQARRELTLEQRNKLAEMQALSAVLMKRDQRLQTLSAEVTERDQQLQALSTKVTKRDQQLQALSAEVTERDQRVQVLKTQVIE